MRKLLLLALIPVMAACSKNSGSSNSNSPCNNITEVTSVSPYGNPPQSSIVATISYDSKGRVLSVIGESQNRSHFSYSNNKIVIEATDINGVNIGMEYYLDGKGRITGSNIFNNEYTYNSDGYLVSFKKPYGNNGQITGSSQITLKYTNGNLVEYSNADQFASNHLVTVEYSNEPAQELMGYNAPLYLTSAIGDRNSFFLIKSGFFGKQSANLVKSLDFHEGYPVNPKEYSYDSKGRINVMANWRFKYQCD